MMVPLRHVVYYVNPQERKPQAQRDWLDLLQGRAHNVHEVDVCALSLLLTRAGRSGGASNGSSFFAADACSYRVAGR